MVKLNFDDGEDGGNDDGEIVVVVKVEEREEEECLVPDAMSKILLFKLLCKNDKVIPCDASLLHKCTKRQWKILALLSCASMFARYDLVVYALSITQIQASLDITEDEVSYVTMLIRSGAILSFFVSMAADRCGRRQILLYTLLPYTLFTAATAFATNKYIFTIFQLVCRTFIISEMSVSNVTIVEEFDNHNRGWAVGMLGSISSLGVALAIVIFGIIGNQPESWRWMYIIGILPLLLLSYYRRQLPETRRFQRYHMRLQSQQSQKLSQRNDDEEGKEEEEEEEGEGDILISNNSNNNNNNNHDNNDNNNNNNYDWNFFKKSMLPMRLLFSSYPQRLIYASLFCFLVFSSASVGAFYNFKYLQEQHHFKPSDVSLLGIFGGGLSMVMYVISGKLSDHYGRKRLCMFFSFSYLFGLIQFYLATNTTTTVLCWIIFMSCDFGMETIVATYFIELFPTSHRSTASGIQSIATVFGQITGTFIEAIVFKHWTNSHWIAIAYVAIPGLFAPLILLPLPETSAKDIDHISPEIQQQNHD